MFLRSASVLICILVQVGVCLASGATTMPVERVAGPHLVEVLDYVRTAIGFDALNRIHAMEAVGTFDSWDRNKDAKEPSNVRGECRLTFTPQGLFRFVSTTGATSLQGFDGTRQWFMGYSGAAYAYDDPSSLLACWTVTGCWLSLIDELSLPLVDSKMHKDRIILQIGLNRNQAKRWMIVDRRTWLPNALCPVGHAETPEWEFKDYRRRMGVLFPSQIIRYTTDSSSHPTPESTINIDQITEAGSVDQSLYAMPEPLDNVRFQKGSTPDVRCKLADGGPLLVTATLDGKKPRWFVFDSGTNVLGLDQSVLDEIDSQAVDEIGGLISGLPAHAKTVRFQKLKIGPMTIARPIFWSLPMNVIRFMIDKDIDGVIGYDVFRRSIVELDAAKPSVRLYDPALYDGKGLDWRPFRYASNKLIHVLCRFEGNHEGYFLIDTGSNCGVSIRTETFRSLGFKINEKHSHQQFNLGGATFSRSSDKTKLAWFEIGGHRLTDLEVSLDDHVEHYVGVNNIGAVGLAILSQFDVVFDYPNMRMAFVSKKEKQPAQTEAPAAAADGLTEHGKAQTGLKKQ